MKKLKVKTCFNPNGILCEPSPCFKCGEGVCCESFTMSRDNEKSLLPICENCSMAEALIDYVRAYEKN